MNASFSTRPGSARRSVACSVAVAAVVLCGLAGSAAAQAAETTGRIFGYAPAGATVSISNPEFAIQRDLQVNSEGRYMASWLPPGVYTVTVVDNGQPTIKHPSVQLYVDRGSRVDFSCPYGRCAEVAAD